MWIVRLTDKQLEVLRALLRAQEHLGPALQRSLQALDLARWDELAGGRAAVGRGGADREAPGRVGGRRRLGPVRRPPGAGAHARRAPSPVARARRAHARPSRARSVARRSPIRSCGRSWRSPTSARRSCGGGMALLVRLVVQRVADRHRHVEADEVEQLQRPHRMRGSVGHASVDVLGRHLRRLEHPHRVEQIREQQPVDDEPGLVRHLDRSLAEPRAPRSDPLRDAGRRPSGRHSSTSSIRGTGLKT